MNTALKDNFVWKIVNLLNRFLLKSNTDNKETLKMRTHDKNHPRT